MHTPDLVVICGVAFLMVFTILAVLAFIMRLIIIIFPQKKIQTDAAVLAAISSAAQGAFPGTKIIQIEEKK